MVAGACYAVVHHLGVLPGGLGVVPGTATRWTDWIDLAIPYVVLGPLWWGLLRAQLSARAAWAAGVGTVMYASGHGIHLAANSVANLHPAGEVGETAHLWDETVGHLVWYGGVALLLAVVAPVLGRLARPQRAVPYLVALGVGATWGTNAVGGGTEVLSAGCAAALVVFGTMHRATAAVALVPAFAVALVVVALGR